MKRLIILALAISTVGALGQTIPTTPNFGLQLIPDGYPAWGVPYRATMNTIDSLVAPLASPHFTGTFTLPTSLNGCLYATSGVVSATGSACGAGGSVSSVFGRTGAVTATSGDYSFSQISGLMNFATQGTGLVPVANGGTGTSSPALVQGTNVTITGSWPNQTINATASAQVYPAAGVAVSTGSAWGSSLTAPSGALVGTTDTQTLTNKTVDGVTPTTFGFLDPTSSVQTQLNLKAPLASPAFTGTATAVNLTVSGTCTGCGTGSSGISGGTAGYVPLFGSATTITGPSHMDDGVTTAATITSSEPITVNVSGAPHQVSFTYNSIALVPGSSTTAVYGVNASGQAIASEAGAAASRLCTAANGVCSSGSVTFPWSCQPGLGDGLNVITAGTYLQTSCYNDTGQTVTLTGLRCYADAGTPTMNVTNGAGTGLLTGAVTCTTAFAAGTQSGTTTIASGDYLKFTFVASGTAKQATFVATGTHP